MGRRRRAAASRRSTTSGPGRRASAVQACAGDRRCRRPSADRRSTSARGAASGCRGPSRSAPSGSGRRPGRAWRAVRVAVDQRRGAGLAQQLRQASASRSVPSMSACVARLWRAHLVGDGDPLVQRPRQERPAARRAAHLRAEGLVAACRPGTARRHGTAASAAPGLQHRGVGQGVMPAAVHRSGPTRKSRLPAMKCSGRRAAAPPARRPAPARRAGSGCRRRPSARTRRPAGTRHRPCRAAAPAATRPRSAAARAPGAGRR
jgi:hypothetical protein